MLIGWNVLAAAALFLAFDFVARTPALSTGCCLIADRLIAEMRDVLDGKPLPPN
ncbi:MAG: hypothetical protein JOY94_12635 [Methylobacteriaceae bacterium]|nr:hypothetical protein [Methylobacteriaceae bacterium]